MIAIDIETTGLDPAYCQILEIGAIVVDSKFEEIDRFHSVIKYQQIRGEPYALEMNGDLLVADGEGVDSVRERWEGWYSKYRDEIILGKNFGGFDKVFLEKNGFSCGYRVLDIGSLVWLDQRWNGNTLAKVPSLEDCKKLYEISGPVVHRSIDDCLDYIRILKALDPKS